MTEDTVRRLNEIKENIHEGTYPLLEKTNWDRYSESLRRAINEILRKATEVRSLARKTKLPFLFFKASGNIKILNTAQDALLDDFELFFDAYARFSKADLNGGETFDFKRQHEKDYIDNSYKHCDRLIKYISDNITTKHVEYRHCQTLFVALVAVVIAVIALIWR